jgi:hypothetical protein
VFCRSTEGGSRAGQLQLGFLMIGSLSSLNRLSLYNGEVLKVEFELRIVSGG